MTKFKVKGLDKLQKQFKKMERAARELEETSSISFDELFTSPFMQKHTLFSSFDEFIISGGFNVETQEDFEAIPEKEMDEHVAKTTNFEDWETMLDTATTEHLGKLFKF